MPDYPTMPNPALQTKQRSKKPHLVDNIVRTQQSRSIPYDSQQSRQISQRPSRPKRKISVWLLLIPIGLVMVFIIFLLGGVLLLRLSFANTILPGVYVGEVSLGGLSQHEAIQRLNSEWQNIVLKDGNRRWTVNAATLGIHLDAILTAENAFAQGHGEGGLTALFQDVQVAPVISVDSKIIADELSRIAPGIEIAPVNAGVKLVNGQVQATVPEYGRLLDVNATINVLLNKPNAVLKDGALELVMLNVAPNVLDSSAIVAQAQALLSNPLDIRVFDPVTGDSVYWSLMPQEWGSWLTASSNPNNPIGLSLDVDETQLRAYLGTVANQTFDNSRYIDLDESLQSVRQALAAGKPQNIALIVRHHERVHSVQSGETITSIAWDYGIPYLYILEANGGIESVSIGQVIQLPPADLFLEYPVNPNKRIVVDISEQRTRVYENGAMIYDWVTSTGIADSPTWPGIYQILSHESNAYAGNWNLYMPYFMGVYQPIPNSEFTNGFHGFPTRGGGQILWQNNLGTKVTFGCIMLSDTNVEILYNWAEEGVVVEIRP